jgi:hypothetical protein
MPEGGQVAPQAVVEAPEAVGVAPEAHLFLRQAPA